MTAHVVDYSFWRPSSDQLRRFRAAGTLAICRYLSVVTASTRGKILTRSEADMIKSAGLDIVSNWEFDAADALGGYEAGRTYARIAAGQHATAGGPLSRPITYSVDFDVTPGQLSQVLSYAHGWRDVLGVARCRAYAQASVLDELGRLGLISGGFEVGNGWSHGEQSRWADLTQVAWNSTFDTSDVAHADYGQWGYVAPQPKQQEARMNRIVRWDGHPHLVLTDGQWARWIPSEADEADEHAMQADYLGNKMPGRPYPAVANLRVLGVFHGEVPASIKAAGARVDAGATILDGK